MGLKAKWTITCDGYGCGVTVVRECGPEDEDGKSVSDWTDPWGPGIPDYWLQVPHDDVTGRDYLFFHSDDCYKKWLEHQERYDELHSFENADWLA